MNKRVVGEKKIESQKNGRVDQPSLDLRKWKTDSERTNEIVLSTGALMKVNLKK